MKKQVNNILATISYEQASAVIKGNSIAELINGAPEAKFPLGLKKLIALMVALFAPIMLLTNYIARAKSTTLSDTLEYGVYFTLMGLAFYLFIKKTSLFANARYKFFINNSVKIFVYSYVCAIIGVPSDHYGETLLTVLILFSITIVIQFFTEKNLIIKEINEKFQTEFRTNKFILLLFKISGACLTFGIVAMIFYRQNKFWLMWLKVPDLDFGTVINNIIGLLFFTVLIPIPTYLGFDPELYVKAKLVEQYSEQFRTKYQYPKEIWYGE